jgi:hypothetical protein
MEYLERWRAVSTDPQFMQSVFDHVASGGSLIALCRTLDIKYATLLQWLHRDPERDKQYNLALTARAEWAMERVLAEIQLIGTVDIRRAYDDNGELMKVRDMPDDVARALVSVDVNDNPITGISTKIKLIDKLKALELMGKNFGMFIDRHEIDLGKQTLEALVSGSMPDRITKPIETEAIISKSETNT